MHFTTRRVGAVIAATLAAVMITSTSAGAAKAPSSPATEQVTITGWSSSTFEDIYERMVDTNGSEATSDFLAAQLEEPTDDVLDALNLDQLSATESDGLLETALLASEKDVPLAAAASDSEDGGVSIQSLSTAPVLGGPGEAGFNWFTTNRLEQLVCDITGDCEVAAYVEIRFATNPGEFTSTTDLNFRVFGTAPAPVRVNSSVYFSSRQRSVIRKTWNTPGSGTQYNDHTSTNGRAWQGYYYYSATVNGEAVPAEHKTTVSNPCGEFEPGAYACRWL